VPRFAPVIRAVPSALAVALVAGAAAVAGGWQPGGLRQAATTLDAVLAKTARATAETPPPDRIDTYRLDADGTIYTAVVRVRGADYRADATLGGVRYAEGRVDGVRWRATPNGVEHRIRADAQGDDLDRWPLGLFGLPDAGLALAGERDDPTPTDVLVYRDSREYTHWFFVDAATGALTGEETREGARVVTYAFDRDPASGEIAGFRATGAGGPLTAVRVAREVRPLAPADVASAPPEADALQPSAERARTTLATRFSGHRILVSARVDGRATRLLLDTGTPGLVLAQRLVDALGLPRPLGHAVVPDVEVGGEHLRDVAVTTHPLGAYDGILGYAYFRGRRVHVDYARERVSVEPASAPFDEPDARDIPARCDEGMPLATVDAGDVRLERMVLDTGSDDVVIARDAFAGTASRTAFGLRDLGAPRVEGYLEGAVTTRPATLDRLRLGARTYRDVPVDVEGDAPNDADFPIDGIVGTSILGRSEWWFDEAACRIAVR
jgi:predicted aspartyl protease